MRFSEEGFGPAKGLRALRRPGFGFRVEGLGFRVEGFMLRDGPVQKKNKRTGLTHGLWGIYITAAEDSRHDMP